MIERGGERNRMIERGRERNRTIELMVSHTPLSHFKCQILQIVVKKFPDCRNNVEHAHLTKLYF